MQTPSVLNPHQVGQRLKAKAQRNRKTADTGRGTPPECRRDSRRDGNPRQVTTPDALVCTTRNGGTETVTLYI